MIEDAGVEGMEQSGRFKCKILRNSEPFLFSKVVFESTRERERMAFTAIPSSLSSSEFPLNA